jgi:hypothetical protein
MPAGDDLTVVLFLWSSALAIGLYVLAGTGWKHHYLIPGLVVLAAVLILIGVAWVPAKEGPITARAVGMLTQAANSRWAWLAVGVLFGAVVWRSLPDMAQRFPLLRPVIEPRYISLHDAALRLYERISRGAPTTDRVLTDQEVLRTYASIVLRYDFVRIFGRRPPSREFREIPKADYEHLFVGPDATTLQRAVLSDKPIFTDVAIPTRDYRKHVATMQLDSAEWPIH